MLAYTFTERKSPQRIIKKKAEVVATLKSLVVQNPTATSGASATSSRHTTPPPSAAPSPPPPTPSPPKKRKLSSTPDSASKKARTQNRVSALRREFSAADGSTSSSGEDGDHVLSRKKRREGSVVSSPGAFGALEKPILRDCSIMEDGRVECVTAEKVVRDVMKEYKAYFRNLDDPNDKSFEPHATDYPVVEIEYPNYGASERFILLFPIDKDDYQPIKELMYTLYTTVECYLPVPYRTPFGEPVASTGLLTPASTTPASTPPPPSISGSVTPPPQTPSPQTPSPQTPPRQPLFRVLQKAHNTRNGPLFVQTVQSISALLRDLKPVMAQYMKDTWTGIPNQVWRGIVEESYQRSVGPRVDELRKYTPFSDLVYGELNTSFVSDIVHRIDLRPGKVFVDLGCGVGNCLFQASLQSGCTSKGIELHPPPSQLSHIQQTQFNARLRLYGVSSGDIVVRTGDFCESADVREWMKEADVVLVNNWAFSPALNERLSLLFLDLQEGAKVVSLRPFLPSDFRLTERTVSSPLAILSVEECAFSKGSVSWTNEGGTYYINTIDRNRVCKFVEMSMNNINTRPGRSRRAR